MTELIVIPKLTIITIAKNNYQGLLKTLESLRGQDFKAWSLVIVVGKSTDDTLSLAKEFSSKFEGTSVVEQTDSGIYEAMNLGMRHVDSDYVWFMNSGDTFHDSRSLKFGTLAASRQDCALIVGHHQIQGDNRKFKNSVGKLHPLAFAFSRRGSCHQAMIFKTSFLNKNSMYDTKYKYCADYKLALSLAIQSSCYRISETLCSIEPGGVSDTNLRGVHKEKSMIRAELFGDKYWINVLSRMWIFLLFSKIFLRKYLSKFNKTFKLAASS
jgi:glycosyltransferase involved in cell wall biosynthesis